MIIIVTFLQFGHKMNEIKNNNNNISYSITIYFIQD